jgi:hypothetical protein
MSAGALYKGAAVDLSKRASTRKKRGIKVTFTR